MKKEAIDSFIKVLTKVCTDEKIDINLNALSDKELKELYLKLQTVRNGRFPYGITKGDDFQTALESGSLQTISFRDAFKYGVRRLTFKEYLLLCEFADKNPSMYKFL